MAVNRLTRFSAYQGGSWQSRGESHQTECARHSHWLSHGQNSEFGKLQRVLINLPELKPRKIKNPENVQHLHSVNWVLLRRELNSIQTQFEAQGIEVLRLKSESFSSPLPNLMFCRDHFFMTPWGAILGRMASIVRAGEEKWAQTALAQAGVPILQMIRGRGLFEGADALWLNAKTVLVGVGNRTNREGAAQLDKVLREFNVNCVTVPLPQQTQHLLGILQLVAPKVAVIRKSIAPPHLLRILKKHRFRWIEVAESEEVTALQGMNFVAVDKMKIIMVAGSPQLKKQLRSAGIKTVAEVRASQLLNAAGGLACATGILSRSLQI